MQFNFETRHKIRLMTPAVFVFGMAMLAVFATYQAWLFYQEKSLEQQEVARQIELMRSKIQMVQSNKEALEDKVDDYNESLHKLIPDKEDYFSIIDSLNELSRKTGFKATDYNVSFDEEKTDRVSIKVTGQGSQDDFVRFLSSYRFGGGRFITIDKINFDKTTGITTLDLNFYSKNIEVSTVNSSSETSKNKNILLKEAFASEDKDVKMTKNDLEMLDKINQELSTSQSNDTKGNYSTTSDPF